MRLLVVVATLTILLALMLICVFKPEYMREAISAILEWVYEKAPIASEMLETGIESVAFVVGRAAARFGKGFTKGYNA
jgi:choline-glycine betaine transporter